MESDKVFCYDIPISFFIVVVQKNGEAVKQALKTIKNRHAAAILLLTQ